MASMPTPSPYSESVVSQGPSKKVSTLLGLEPNAPAYSPFQALSRQASDEAKMLEGVTTHPTWSSIYQFYGVPEGQDLTGYLNASKRGGMLPSTVGADTTPQSPAAGSIPEYVAPSDEASTKKAAGGGLMSLRKFASGGDSTPKDLTSQQLAKLNHLNARVGYGQTLSTKDQNTLNALTQQQQAYTQYQNDQAPPGTTPSLAQALTVQTPGIDLTQLNNQYAGVTNPIFQQALNNLNSISQAPSQFQQGTNTINQASQGLFNNANYTPAQVNAINEQAATYQAALMNAPQDIQAQAYDAAQAATNQMAQPRNVRAVQVGTNQMAGPQSWTSPGTAAQYMDPYEKQVLSNQLQLANQQNAQQNNLLKSQAAQAGAYGGARQQLALGQQQLNQNLANQNLVAQGLSNAYQSGLSQFNTAQGQGLQAGQANLSAAQQSALANQQAGMTAQQLNQAAGLTAGQANLSAAQQTALANQAALNNQRSQYVTQALQAATTNYGGQLTAAQQNQIAQNAAAQFNASAQNQMSLANQTAGMNAQQLNQAAGLSANQQNLGAYTNAGQLGQGLGSLGASLWSGQQQIPQLYGTAASGAQSLAQQAATGAQQTAQNYWGGINSAYQPVTNLLGQFGGTTGTNNTSKIPGGTV